MRLWLLAPGLTAVELAIPVAPVATQKLEARQPLLVTRTQGARSVLAEREQVLEPRAEPLLGECSARAAMEVRGA